METMQTEEVLEKYPLGDEVVIGTLDLPEILMGFVVPVQEFKNIPYLSHFPFVTTVLGEEIYAKKDQVVYAGDLARAFEEEQGVGAYIIRRVNMTCFKHLMLEDNEKLLPELNKLEHLCVPNTEALLRFIQRSCPNINDLINRKCLLTELSDCI